MPDNLGAREVYVCIFRIMYINTLKSIENGHYLADDMFETLFVWKLVYFEAYFTEVCSRIIEKNAGIGSDSAWCQKGDKPLSEPVVTDIIGAYELRINTWNPHLPIDHPFADDIFKCILV